MIQDGKFLQSDFTFFNSDGTKSTGTGIPGFDPKTNRFTTVWYDSRQTTMSIRQSDGTFDGKNIVLWTTLFQGCSLQSSALGNGAAGHCSPSIYVSIQKKGGR